MKPSLVIHCKVPRDVAKRLAPFIRQIAAVITVRHDLAVYIVPACIVWAGDRNGRASGFGVFTCFRRKPVIYIAGIPLSRREMTRADWIHGAKHTIAHEFVHYEQFRDGRRLTERGVEMRAARLVRLAEVRK